MFRQSGFGRAGPGGARLGAARHGAAGQSRHGGSSRGLARLGRARLGWAGSRGPARQGAAGLGRARLGGARRGTAGSLSGASSGAPLTMADIFAMELEAERQATNEAWLRQAVRRAHRRHVLRWWNPLVQVVVDPASAPSTSGVSLPPLRALGVDGGVAGSSPTSPAASAPASAGIGIPGSPTCLCASCISGRRTYP